MCFNSVTHGCTNEFAGLWLKVMSSRDQTLDSAGDSGSSFHFILKAQYTCFEIPLFTPMILYLFTSSRISNQLHRTTFHHQQNKNQCKGPDSFYTGCYKFLWKFYKVYELGKEKENIRESLHSKRKLFWHQNVRQDRALPK